jgi:ATP-binding cassette subfamily B protein/subfamily B ATP-binding cassette protein MsbA
MLPKLYPFWRSALPVMAGGFALLLVSSALELLQPWPVKWLVDYTLGRHPLPPLLRAWLPSLGSARIVDGAMTVCLCVLGLAALNKAANVISNLLLLRAGEKTVFDLRCRAFDQLQRLSLAYHDKTKVSESLYRVAYDAYAAQSLLSGAIVPMVTGALMLCGILAVMVRIDLAMTLITLAVGPLFFLTITGFGKRIGSASKRYHESETALVGAAQEALTSMRAVQAFTMESAFGVRFREQARTSFKAHEQLMWSQLIFAGFVGVAMALGTAGVIWVGAHRLEEHRLLVGDVLVFLAYLGMLYQPVNSFCQSASAFKSSAVQLNRVFEVIEAVSTVTDRLDAKTASQVAGEIEFKAVNFHYEADRPVLRDICVRIPARSVVAVVGRTGAGKTTLASLLTRFYDPVSGAILLDGHDLRELRLDWLRQQISVVLQDPILFASTVRQNIAAGCPSASQAEIETAARRAQIHEDILKFQDGYDTLLGERGVNLSGGQRQRVSIARALLKNAPILVLDEPSSSLDSRTEGDLLGCLRELVRGRTTLIIAHRLTTVTLADQILVLDEGRVAELGSHAELLRAGRLYPEIYEMYWHPERGSERNIPDQELMTQTV